MESTGRWSRAATRAIAAGFGLSFLAFSGVPLRGIYRLYRGPALPLSQVAILASESGSDSDSLLRLISIDGIHGPAEETGYSSVRNQSFNLELLPGPHTVTLRYWEMRRTGTSRARGLHEVVFAFVAAPGRLYRARVQTNFPVLAAGHWTAKIEEEGPIPVSYPRPTHSCESFPKNGSGCLDVRVGIPESSARGLPGGNIAL
jgi:hypothetical protein